VAFCCFIQFVVSSNKLRFDFVCEKQTIVIVIVAVASIALVYFKKHKADIELDKKP
jgi:hypothetical protein